MYYPRSFISLTGYVHREIWVPPGHAKCRPTNRSKKADLKLLLGNLNILICFSVTEFHVIKLVTLKIFSEL